MWYWELLNITLPKYFIKYLSILLAMMLMSMLEEHVSGKFPCFFPRIRKWPTNNRSTLPYVCHRKMSIKIKYNSIPFMSRCITCEQWKIGQCQVNIWPEENLKLSQKVWFDPKSANFMYLGKKCPAF